MRYLVLVAALASCAKSADQLWPFPCADDLTCPAGLACVGATCMPAQVDSICTAGSDPTDCSKAAPGAVCSATSADGEAQTGACGLPCDTGCAGGRVCSEVDGSGVCLVDCNGSSLVCPQNTFCVPRSDGHKVCMPPGVGCRALENVRRCSSELCQARYDDVTCPNGSSYCPAESTCSSDSTRCTCEQGLEAIDCSDQPCNNGCGGNRRWWCAPNVAAAGCFSDLGGIRATCQCWRSTIEIACDQEGVTCDELCRRQ